MISIEGMGTATLAAIRVRQFYYTEPTNGRRSVRPTALSLSADIDKIQADSSLSRATQWLSYSVYDKGIGGSGAAGKHAESEAGGPE